MTRAGLYIHVPFCVRKCPYCDFYSLTFEEEAASAYTAALLRAMDIFAASSKTPPRFDTVYFGGGTPSLLGESRLTRLLDRASTLFGLDTSCEITLEANPGTVNRGLLSGLRKAGFNRVSMGVQSAVDSELIALGRIHAAKDAWFAIEAAYAAGFDNISADLMLGIPGQTQESLTSSIEFLSALPVTHVSAYMLKIEPGTAFDRRDDLSLPNEDEVSNLYIASVEKLEASGFSQYEISNFAKPGYACRHNLGYWRCQPYLGLGPAAHSFLDGRRRFFGRDISAFISADDPFSLWEDDGPGGGPDELLMLGLRLTEGFDSTRLAGFGIDSKPLLDKAAELSSHSLCLVNDGIISLTPKGFLLSNPVTLSLLEGLNNTK